MRGEKKGEKKRVVWLAGIVILYLLLTCYQLGLPGLHYDEAREAGVNAMELLTQAPTSAFRNASITLWGIHFPLMVQDYIGAFNVYLALPFLALTGIGVPNLRIVGILTGLATLLLLERILHEWLTQQSTINNQQSALVRVNFQLSILLLTVSPSFIFWSRQGIYVTNLTQPLCLWAIWQGICWWRTGQRRALLLCGLAGGLALYAKLLALWVVAPLFLLLGWAWLWRWWHSLSRPSIDALTLIGVLVAFGVGISPLLLYNWQTGGTLINLSGNLTQSYYGVNNSDLWGNAGVRLTQLMQVLRGDQFSHLGASFANPIAPLLFVLFVGLGLWYNWRAMLPPLFLLVAAFVASLFTGSGLFVTHYALLWPLMVGIVGIIVGHDFGVTSHPSRQSRDLRLWLMILWIGFDLFNTLRYHQALAQSGGLDAHSDATYHLAYHLRYNGMGAPIVLDWGIDAPVRYLSEGAVQPIEIFGYASLQRPDDGFAKRLEPFLQNPNNVYLFHTPEKTVFLERREAFFDLTHKLGLAVNLEKVFSERSGTKLFELWKVNLPVQ